MDHEERYIVMNMHDINLNSWEEFEAQLRELETERLAKESASKFLYRGQSDHTKHLLTTLERNGKERLSFKEYYHLISVVQPQIESFTGANWNILAYPQGIDKWLDENSSYMPHSFGGSHEFNNIYSFMVYLRHYGFPSPLLDWTVSPYVAGYFAFREATISKNDVLIYVYLETPNKRKSKGCSSSDAYIYTFGPYVRTDRRHFLQQSRYTICMLNDGEWRFVPHEDAFARCDPDQDLLWKFNIPYSERLKVLKMLDSYNINALSLFGSVESLMEAMALREVHLREKEL